MTATATFKRDPKFGYDPWLGKSTPAQAASVHLAAGRVYAGADTIGGDIGLLPAGLDMYASYVDNFGGYNELVARFGSKFPGLLLSITIFGGPARCADVEPGAMHASSFPGWYDHTALRTVGQLPWGYTSASNMQALIDAAGPRKFIRWSAHFGHGPHVCGPGTCGYPQADWTQWDDKGAQGQNLDRSIGLISPYLTPAPSPAPPSPPQKASGKARALITVDLATNAATIHGLPGVHIHWGQVDEEISKEIQLGRGGKIRGRWREAPMPYNAPPLGK